MFPSRTSSFALGGAAFLVSSLLSLAGCDGALRSIPIVGDVIAVTGNWQIASTAPAAAQLPAITGELTGTSTAMTGLFHSDSQKACVSPTQTIAVSGSANAQNMVTLTGAMPIGGSLTVNGTLAGDGKSLSNATYKVAGGSCAFAQVVPASAQAYQPITGSYNGSFADTSGSTIAVNANLTQTPAADVNGNFQLSGTGTFPNNPCFTSPVTVSNTQVTGGSFSLTYADPNTLNSVTASGTFSPDGRSLNVTQWTLTGSCGPDSGTGALAQ